MISSWLSNKKRGASMKKMTLSGAWQFRQAGTNEWLPATVPGGVHSDLMALGKIPDPFVADNELKVMWVAETDWEYRRTFSAEAALLAEPIVALVGSYDFSTRVTPENQRTLVFVCNCRRAQN